MSETNFSALLAEYATRPPLVPALPKTKRCSKCGTEKPVAEFSLNRQNKGGLQAWCKRCNAVANRRTPLVLSRNGQKICSMCREAKPHAEFHKCADNTTGLQSRCKECQRLARSDKPVVTVGEQFHIAAPMPTDDDPPWEPVSDQDRLAKVQAEMLAKVTEMMEILHRYLTN